MCKKKIKKKKKRLSNSRHKKLKNVIIVKVLTAMYTYQQT